MLRCEILLLNWMQIISSSSEIRYNIYSIWRKVVETANIVDMFSKVKVLLQNEDWRQSDRVHTKDKNKANQRIKFWFQDNYHSHNHLLSWFNTSKYHFSYESHVNVPMSELNMYLFVFQSTMTVKIILNLFHWTSSVSSWLAVVVHFVVTPPSRYLIDTEDIWSQKSILN